LATVSVQRVVDCNAPPAAIWRIVADTNRMNQAMGLSPLLVKEVFGIIRRLNEELGITILLVEQNARMALSVASYGYVMEGGKVVLDGTAEALSTNEDVKEFYLGGHGAERKSFRGLKSYKRRKRWL
jgi:branched-chain amino acid transport system ATP-binding protein